MVNHNGTLYTYIKNLHGDIVGILDSSNAILVEYKYDAWGSLILISGHASNTLGLLNPFRYRGYVYDIETSLYYLVSRYYNSSFNKFLLLDRIYTNNAEIINSNFYTYCKTLQ